MFIFLAMEEGEVSEPEGKFVIDNDASTGEKKNENKLVYKIIRVTSLHCNFKRKAACVRQHLERKKEHVTSWKILVFEKIMVYADLRDTILLLRIIARDCSCSRCLPIKKKILCDFYHSTLTAATKCRWFL